TTGLRSRPRPSVRHADRLGLEVLLVAFLAIAVAQPALLGAPERAADAEVALAVDRDVAGAHALGDLERPVDVAAADLAGEPVDGVVGDRDGLVVRVVRRHRHHRAENLLRRALRTG